MLTRANGRCTLCGKLAKDTPIDIDHIIPVSKGGKTDLSNLQALCASCNRSKRNRDKTDFRDYGADTLDNSCVFCNLGDRVIGNHNTAFRILDNYPISPSHTLLITKRHISSVSELAVEELADLFQLAKLVTNELRESDKTIEGFNIGFNDGEVAGQSINHVHLHIIPRRKGDIENPRGGIRNILPDLTGYNSNK